MGKITYTVPEVPESKRVSARPYTHAIIGCRDPKVVVATMQANYTAKREQYRRWETKHWNDEKRAAEAVVGQKYLNHNGYMVEAKDYVVDAGKSFMSKYPTLESYLADLDRKHEESIQSELAQPKSPLSVLRWSQSHDNAKKALGEFEPYYSGLRVVPCVPKPSKASQKGK